MQDNVEKIKDLLSECKRLMNSHPTLAEEKAKKALRLSTRCKSEEGRYESLFHLSTLRYTHNQNERAISTLNECLSIAEKRKDYRSVAQVKNALGMAYHRMDINSKALDCYLEALELAKKHEANELICRININIADFFSTLKDYENGLNYLISAYGSALRLNEPLAMYFRNLAQCYLDLQQYEEAYKYCVLARKANWKHRDETVWADIYFIYAALLMHKGKKNRAVKVYHYALWLSEKFHNFYSHVKGLIQLAQSLMTENDLASALKALDKAEGISKQYQYLELHRRICGLYAEIFQRTGDMNGELAALREYRLLTDKLEEKEHEKKRTYAHMQLTLHHVKKENQHLKENVELDPLTGCLCYRDFESRIKQALEDSEYTGALLFLDVDDLKTVNDKYGHHAGDRLIIEFANAIKKVFQSNAIKVRKGGDEFVVYLPRAGRNYIIQVIEELFAYLSRPRIIGKTLMPLSCSIGIAMAPMDSTSPIELEAMADMAMYHAKKAGKRCYSFYDSLKEYGILG